MIEELFRNKKAVSPVIAIVLLLMMTVAAAGAAYFWITSMQSSVQQSAGSQIEAITKQASTRVIAQATLCKPPAEDDLVGYWKFDQGEGTTAKDSAGGNDGAINGASWVKYGERYALEFDGSDDYMRPPTDYVPTTGTITAWIKPRSTSHSVIFRSAASGEQIGLHFGYEDQVYMLMQTNGGTNYKAESSALTVGNWYFLVGKWNSSDIWLYINGNKINKTSHDGTASGTYDWIIGAHRDEHHFFNGIIDEPRIYDKALTGEKVKSERVDVTVYNAGAEAVPEGTWVANLIKNGNTIESDTYNASRLDSEERITLNFYFSKLHPGGEYTIELEGTQTSTTVSC